MLKNNFVVAFRNLMRNKGYSTINIAGLALGMAVTILIGLWIHDELSFNRNHSKYEHIAQVYFHQTVNGQITTIPACPMPTGAELKTTYKNYFNRVVTIWWPGSHNLSIGDKKTSQNGTFIEADGLELFSFNMIRGDRSALSDPLSIILSEPAAKALFGNADPINQLVRLDDQTDLKVTGVYSAMPHNSRFYNIQFVSSWDMWVATNDWLKKDEHNWNQRITTFVELNPGVSVHEVNAAIKDLKKRNITADQAAHEEPTLFLEPMSRWHLYSEWREGKPAGGRIQFVWLFGIIGVFVLLLACINFMNLSTAQSARRAREVGIRKSIGSVRGQLVRQFLTESFVIVLLSFAIALAIVAAVLPGFNELTDKRMDGPWTTMFFWMAACAFVGVTSLISGSYPALYLSSFEPVKVLKGTFKAGRFASVPRKVLVVVQFTVSVALIIGTVVVWQQVQFAKDRPVGYTRNGLIMIRKTVGDFYGKSNALEHAMKATGAITDMAESSSPTTEVWFNTTGLDWRGKDPNAQIDFATMAVTHDYGKTVAWKFLKGRDFSREHSTDSSGIVLNEEAARVMGFEDPIGEEITWNGRRMKIIGLIQNMIVTSPFEPVKQTVYYLSYDEAYLITARVNPIMSMSEAIQKIAKVTEEVIPSVLFDYKFVDDEYALKFSGEERIGKLASLFASLAIFISCLGLFGMASFVAEQRRKEIGIRKILGADISTLWRMLSVEFVQLVALSCGIGIPVAWFYLNNWLAQYTYRIDISIWVLIGSALGALAITLLTVSFQTLRASLSNPIASLKMD